MDIKNINYHAQVSLSGVANPLNLEGNIARLMIDVTQHLIQSSPRADQNGTKEIVIRIRNKPFNHEKEKLDTRAQEIVNQLDDSNIDNGPRENEDYLTFTTRLLESGLAPAAAMMIAGDWFDQPPPEGLIDWINDSKAIRFRELNSRDEAFKASIPGEYESLKIYVECNYPNFIDGLTFRIA